MRVDAGLGLESSSDTPIGSGCALVEPRDRPSVLPWSHPGALAKRLTGTAPTVPSHPFPDVFDGQVRLPKQTHHRFDPDHCQVRQGSFPVGRLEDTR